MEGVRPRHSEAPLVRRLIEQGIRDPRVLAAFGRVPRRFFVPEEAQAYAEGDHPLEIGYGQTISQPYIVAAMTEALDLQGRERVLEVGTGSGYQTAILAELLPLGSTVRTIEILLEQLAPGGRLVIPVGPDPEHQELQLWRKLPGSGALDRKVLMHVRFVPLTGPENLH